MMIPWWFVLIVWPLMVGVLSFTVGYMMATGRPWWVDLRLRQATRRKRP